MKDPRHVLVVGIEAERCHAGRVDDVGLPDLRFSDNPDRSRPGLHSLGGRKNELESGGLGGAGRRRRHARRQSLGFDRHVA